MVQPGEWGVVRFVNGEREDQLGYYDDDEDVDGKTRAVVYLGQPCFSGAIHAMLRELAPATEVETQKFERQHLDRPAILEAASRVVEAATPAPLPTMPLLH